MVQALVLATLLLVVVTLLPFWRHPHWTVRCLDFPRLQFVVFALILLVLQLDILDLDLAQSRALVAATLICLAWQLRWILPYTLFWPKQVKTVAHSNQDFELSIITANVLATNRDAERLLALVERYRPDVLVTLESDDWWQASWTGCRQRCPIA